MTDRIIPVLYIEDDATLARLVQRMLARRGYAVEHALDAASGLERLRAGGFDVVILDHDLGTASGFDVLAGLAGVEGAPPVIYVTATSELSLAVQALKAGAVDYVVKTVGEDFEVLLVAALEQSVQRARLQRAREQAERDIRAARDRAEMLLAEVNHRVANSLALVTSLVRMQASSLQDPAAKAALNETQARIVAIANLHRSLYTSDDVRVVELGAYLGSLMGELELSLASDGATPRLSVSAAHVDAKTDKAVSIGMIATELVTNALKYAYSDAHGEVRVSLERDGDDSILLAVEDDGVGWSGEGASQGTGLGSKIVKAMAKSLGSEVAYQPRPKGTRAELRMRDLA